MQTIDNSPDLKTLLTQRLEDQRRREAAASYRRNEGIAALKRLVTIAKSNTGQARRVADFLLAWWNAGSCGSFDLTNLWAVDGEVADDMVTVFRLIADYQEYPTAYGLGKDFEQIVAEWRPELLK